MLHIEYSVSVGGGALAALVAGKLLLDEKYARTWLLVLRHSSAFWRYVAYYGALGFLATAILLLTPLADLPLAKIFCPLTVGFLGPIAKTSLVGWMPFAEHSHQIVRCALLLFEPALLKQIRDDEYFALKREVKSFATLWPEIQHVRSAIKANLPDLDDIDRLRFLDKLEKRTTIDESMIDYYRFFGRNGFIFVFAKSVGERVKTEPRAAVQATQVPQPVETALKPGVLSRARSARQ